MPEFTTKRRMAPAQKEEAFKPPQASETFWILGIQSIQKWPTITIIAPEAGQETRQ
jgi:hypothetical protein